MRHHCCIGTVLLGLLAASCGGPATRGMIVGTSLGGEIHFAGKHSDRPIAGAEVQLEQDGKIVADTLSDVNGRFQFESLPRGEFNLLIEKGEQLAPYSYQETTHKSLNVLDPLQFLNGRLFLPTILMNARPTVLRGKVVSSENQIPIKNANVFTEPETVQATTDEQGGYRLASDQFEEGIRYAVIASHTDYDNEMSQPVEFKLAQENEVPVIMLKPRILEKPLNKGTPQPDTTAPGIGIPGSGQPQ